MFFYKIEIIHLIYLNVLFSQTTILKRMTELIVNKRLNLPGDIQYIILIFLLGMEGTPCCEIFKTALCEFRRTHFSKKRNSSSPSHFTIYKFLGTRECGAQYEVGLEEDFVPTITYELRVAQFDANYKPESWTKGSIRNIRKYMRILHERFLRRYEALYVD